MTSDMTPTERQSRTKNITLQRQLQFTIQILNKEERSCQQHLDKTVGDYKQFLSDLSNKWVGLETYTQPDTRAMKRDSMVKYRRESSVSLKQTLDSETMSGQLTSREPMLHKKLTERRPTSAGLPTFQTCIEVLDDIIENHDLRKKSNKSRRIGLVIPSDRNSQYGELSKENKFVAENKRHSTHIRPASSHCGRIGQTTAKMYSRPQTAQPQKFLRETANERCLIPNQDSRIQSLRPGQYRRPKSAPPKYELYGRSPAVAKRTIAGILAEMHSRSAATRDMLDRSKKLHNYISSLGWHDS